MLLRGRLHPRLFCTETKRGGLVVSRRAAAHANALANLTAVQRTRRAERARFGASVNHLLAGGFVLTALVLRWASLHRSEAWTPPSRRSKAEQLHPATPITTQADVEALLGEVRLVLERFGITLGSVPLNVQLMGTDVPGLEEGSTTKVLRPPPLLRGIEAVRLRHGLSALAAAQVLAHEYTHCWLWLQQFPPLDMRLEEGLCELLSYLYLLARLRESEDEASSGGAVLLREEAALRAQIASIEANAHPDYGGGFREAVAALKGRSLHELLGHVKRYGVLPPSLAVDSGVDGSRDPGAVG